MRTTSYLPIFLAVFSFVDDARGQAPSVLQRTWLSGDAHVGAATGDQFSPHIARGGATALVVWADRRTALASTGPESGADIFAARIDGTGARLDLVPILVGTAPGADREPRVAWNGESWLVTWVSQAPFASIYSDAIVGRRVSAAGVPLDPAPFFVLGEPNTTVASHALDSDGTQWIAVTGGSTSGMSGVLAARISASGVLLDPVPLQLAPPSNFGHDYTIAFAGGVHLLAWNDWSTANADEVFARRFDANLQPIDAAPLAIAPHGMPDGPPALATRDSEFLVAWPRISSSTNQGEIRAARITSGGVVLDPASVLVSGDEVFFTGQVQCAWDDANWYVAWNYVGLEVARVGPAGNVLDPGGFSFAPPGSTQPSAPVLAGSPAGGGLLVWVDARAGSYEGLDLYAARVVDPANLGVEALVSSGAPAQTAHDLAGEVAVRAVVFRSETSGTRRILVTRLDAAGLPLDPEPIEVASSALQLDTPSIGFDGQRFLIAWKQAAGVATSDTIFVRRMADDGTLLDPAPVAVGTGSYPEVAGLNGDFVVVWTRAVAFPLQQYPNVAVLRGSDGVLVSGPIVVNSTYAVAPDVCVLGGRWLVTWQRNYASHDPHCDVQGVFVEPSGTVGAPFFVHGSFNSYNSEPRVAAVSTDALIVWTHGSSSNQTRRVLARRILADGSLLDATPIMLQPGVAGEQFHPAVAWDGSDFLVAFQDLRNASSLLDTVSDVRAARVGTDGIVRDPVGVAIEVGPESATVPEVLGLGAGRALVSSANFRAEVPYSAYRIGTRVVDAGTPAVATFCFGDGSFVDHTTPCPCGNNGAPGNGCGHSFDANGAHLSATGSAAMDDVVLHSQFEPTSSFTMMMQHASAGDSVFHDGVLCAGGSLVRLRGRAAVGGEAFFPNSNFAQDSTTTLSIRGGVTVGSGATRYYAAWYRNASATFCPPATANVTNGCIVVW